MKECTVSKGSRGEKIAAEILKELGFRQVWKLLDDDNRVSSYDLLAIRWNQRYAINVKFGNTFGINPINLARLSRVYKKHNFKPAYLFIKTNEVYWFYSLDTSFPQKIDYTNQKLEVFENE